MIFAKDHIQGLTYEGLIELRRLVAETQDLIQEEIDKRPQNILTYFGVFVNTVKDGVVYNAIRKVTRIEAISDWTDSRKNPVEYSGYEFDIDGETYYVIHGSNWCSSIDYCGNDLSEYNQRTVDHNTIYNIYADDDGYILDERLDDIFQDEAEYSIIGHILRALEGL